MGLLWDPLGLLWDPLGLLLLLLLLSILIVANAASEFGSAARSLKHAQA